VHITLVRHGQPDWEPDDRAVDEPELTALGHEQARLAAEALRGEAVDALYVSPLRRARETAAPIADALGVEAMALSWLRELRLPELEGYTAKEVQRFFREGRLRHPELWWDGYPGGESFRHFYERVSGGLESLLVGDHRLGIHEDAGHRLWQVPDELRDAHIVLVAHEGTNSVALSHLLGIEPNPWAPLRFSVAWTGLTRVHTAQLGSGTVWSLEYFNRTDHLLPLESTRDGRAARHP